MLAMVSTRMLQLLALACISSVLSVRGVNAGYLLISPESPFLEIGTNFTATCIIINTTEITADDLYWKQSNTIIAEEHYRKINRTAVSVTIAITGEKTELLFCHAKEVSINVFLNSGKFTHGITLTKGYPPVKPVNISCMAVQQEMSISPTINCSWDAVGRQTRDVPVKFTLFISILSSHGNKSEPTSNKHASINVELFPSHMRLEIWVEAQNKLGKVWSDHLLQDAEWFVKPNPPSDVKAISEKSFPTSLLINWTHPIHDVYLILKYQIRFCPNGSSTWNYVPLADTAKYIQSFRLQGLEPDRVYIIQVRCKYYRESLYWSNWSTNITERMPQDQPKSKPDLWRIISESDDVRQVRRVQFICKDPTPSNGRIKQFDLRIQYRKDNIENASVFVNRSDSDADSGQKITVLKQIPLPDNKAVKVSVTASNSVGTSPVAELVIREKAYELPRVEKLEVSPHEGKLWLQWTAPKTKNVTEYVVEWVSGERTDWQRENRSTRRTSIRGNLERFVRYRVSVYPIFAGGWVGEPTSKEAYLEQGAPLIGPTVENRETGCNKAELVWEEISLNSRQGFITNYTIYYTNGNQVHKKTVSANITSYTLRSLSCSTKYDTWVGVSTINGSFNGSIHSFTTQKYAKGEIEGIVAGVSLGLFFIVLIMMLLLLCKEDAIKENCWPWIPNPGESTIGNWSPDYPLKVETPKESTVSGISVLDVDECEGKSMLEEDKASLPLKRDKYLSEEHSSGIGGSSCMSSPRQSVSDSDEGGDLADTTASTVQYSSVVASNGYKGQTPSSQPQQVIFSRSESTQPLLDSEENSDMLLQEGNRQNQRCPRQQSSFPLTARNEEGNQQEVLEPLDFCPLEEDSEQRTPMDSQSAEWLPAAPVSNYMPQLGGYRPQ